MDQRWEDHRVRRHHLQSQRLRQKEGRHHPRYRRPHRLTGPRRQLLARRCPLPLEEYQYSDALRAVSDPLPPILSSFRSTASSAEESVGLAEWLLKNSEKRYKSAQKVFGYSFSLRRSFACRQSRNSSWNLICASHPSDLFLRRTRLLPIRNIQLDNW